MEELLGTKEKIFIGISIVVIFIIRRPEGYLLLVCYFIAALGVFLLTLRDKARQRVEDIKNDLADRRTLRLKCTITKIQRELDEEAYIESVRFYCKYVSPEGKEYKFKSDKAFGISKCKEGDTIYVVVEPENYNNYYVQVLELVEE